MLAKVPRTDYIFYRMGYLSLRYMREGQKLQMHTAHMYTYAHTVTDPELMMQACGIWPSLQKVPHPMPNGPTK